MILIVDLFTVKICKRNVYFFYNGIQDEGLIMVSPAFELSDKIRGMNALSYKNLLKDKFSHLSLAMGELLRIFQQDNASFYTRISTCERFLNNVVHVMPSLSVSLDLTQRKTCEA